MFADIKSQNYFLFEALLTLRMIAYTAPIITGSALAQDKICLIGHNYSSSFCANIQLEQSNEEDTWRKNQVLLESSRFSSYKQLIEIIPVILWCLFLGPFLDNYPTAPYLVMLINLLGDIAGALINLVFIFFAFESSPYFLLLPSVSIWFTGGLMSFSTTAGLYIVLNTPEAKRALKFVVLEVIIILGFALATYVGGRCLQDTSGSGDGPQLRTYHINYLIVLALDTTGLLLLLLLFLIDRSNGKIGTNSTEKSAIRSLLNFNNVKQTLSCFFKPRANNVRMQLLLLVTICFGQMLITIGLGSAFMVQFAEKAYDWAPDRYATYSALQQVASMALLGMSSIVLVVWLKLDDSSLICVAQLSNFAADLIRGTFLSATAFFISLPIGALSGLGVVCAKNKFSKIVPRDEAGKIFSLYGTIESTVPFAATLIYSNIFSLSIGFYPGLIYHFSCLLMIITVTLLTVEHVYCPVKSQEEQIYTDNKADA